MTGESSFELLRCPLHPESGPLRHDPSAGVLACPTCARTFPIVDGIPDLLLPDPEFAEFLASEAEQWDGHAFRYEETRKYDCTYRAAVEATAEALRPIAGDLILDAACGTGMTIRSYRQPGMRIVALDLSMVSLQWQRANLGYPEVLFVRGNLLALPFAARTFSRVLCANAIHHIPGASAREETIRELGRVAQEGARVVVTVNNFSIPKRRAGWSNDGPAGSLSGAVQYIHRFGSLEFHELLATALDVERIRGAGMPLLYRFGMGAISERLERVLRRFPAGVHWADMLIGVGSPRGAATAARSASAARRPQPHPSTGEPSARSRAGR
jgi:SAM-dependent methyltransferase